MNRPIAILMPSLLLLGLSTSCSEQFPALETTDGTVSMQLALTDDGPADLNEVAAWRFDDGILKEKLLPVGSTSGESLTFSPEARSGVLHLLINSSGLSSLAAMTPGSTREEEFLQLTAPANEMTSNGLLMTGSLHLHPSNPEVATVKIQRSVARIDIHTPEADVKVLGLSIQGLYDTGYVFPQDDIAETAANNPLPFTQSYADSPLSNQREVLLYVPEQVNAEGALVKIEALLNGGLHRLQVRLPQQLRRNHIYTIQVRGNGAELSASVLYGGWESGSISGSNPQPTVWVDTELSVLDEHVRIGSHRDSVFFPYTGGDWLLALHTAPQASVQVEGNVPEVTVDATAGATRLAINSALRMPGTSDGLIWLNVSENGVHTGRIALIFNGSPIRLDGMLTLDNNGICDLGRYVDGELGTVEIPTDKLLTIETDSEDAWMRADLTYEDADTRKYRILGGWRPNDPTADGRMQENRLVITDEHGDFKEQYAVRRRNWGLPVVKIGDTWWAKYNLRGDVRSFDDQITCNEDPAATDDMMDLLETLSPDSLLRMMGDQYQGGFPQGLPLQHDGEAFYHEGMRPSGQNFGLLEPTLMAPDGYRIPGYDDFAWLSANDNQNLGGAGSRTYHNRHGDLIRVTITERDVNFLNHPYGVVSFYEFESEGNRWVLFGLGHQWNQTAGSIARMHVLFATYGNPDQTWVMEGYEQADRPGQNWIKFTPQNHIKTRTIRCIKTPVEYMY